MRIREASTEDAQALTKIAHEAKRHWGYPEHWMKHWQADLTITPDFIANNQVFVAEQQGDLLGFYALVVCDGKAVLDHMWVTPEHIGTGVGKELFIHAMRSAQKHNVTEVGIVSDPNAEGFYKKMGAHQVGETRSEIHGQRRSLPRLTINPKTS